MPGFPLIMRSSLMRAYQKRQNSILVLQIRFTVLRFFLMLSKGGEGIWRPESHPCLLFSLSERINRALKRRFHYPKILGSYYHYTSIQYLIKTDSTLKDHLVASNNFSTIAEVSTVPVSRRAVAC